jgi:hypothetical protein
VLTGFICEQALDWFQGKEVSLSSVKLKGPKMYFISI